MAFEMRWKCAGLVKEQRQSRKIAMCDSMRNLNSLMTDTDFRMDLSRAVTCLAAMAVLAGCEEKGAKTYEVPKSALERVPQSQGQPAADPHAGMDLSGADAMAMAAHASEAAATFAVPGGWELGKRSSMRDASFMVQGENGAVADVSLIILSGSAGNALDNVNRWLSQLGQDPVAAERLEALSQRVPTPVGEAMVVDLEGLPPGGDAAKDGEILAAIVSRGGETWFFKMRGNAAVVAAQKTAFLDWVRSTHPVERKKDPHAGMDMSAGRNPHPEMELGGGMDPHAGMEMGGGMSPAAGVADPHAVTGSGSGSTRPQWTVPEGWKEAPASSLRVASFCAEGAGGAKADISVVVLPGDSGGDLDNVNRWRRQIGLEPVAAAELEPVIARFEQVGLTVSMVDLAGAETRMLAGWVRRSDQTWFFKLTGPPTLVEGEKGNFTGFLRSIKFEAAASDVEKAD
jgi:hypothetical protein